MTRCSSSLWIAALCALLAACGSGTPTRPELSRAATSTPPRAAAKTDDGKGDPQARFAAALQLMKEGRRDEAINALEVLSADYPKLSGPATDLGILYAQVHKPAKAIAAFNQAVQANPRNAVALNGLGVLYRESGDFARAEQCYQRALAAQADYAPAHYNLAILYDLALRRPQDALAHYKQYQQIAGLDDKPMVAVWIRELESRKAAAGGGMVAGAQK
ncbi:tetratricopeptide repeat protein [Solimonas soli]|uniref:tetratricopeptide repeat protein n=1 Tax=Solimonas soli TaxID=413479 RepID=UPI0004B278C4|nr:tetratricopeptide repeat protein [Solimonas soli]